MTILVSFSVSEVTRSSPTMLARMLTIGTASALASARQTGTVSTMTITSTTVAPTPGLALSVEPRDACMIIIMITG